MGAELPANWEPLCGSSTDIPDDPDVWLAEFLARARAAGWGRGEEPENPYTDCGGMSSRNNMGNWVPGLEPNSHASPARSRSAKKMKCSTDSRENRSTL